MNKLAVSTVNIDIARMAVSEAATNTEHKVGLQEYVVTNWLTDLNTTVAGIQRMIDRDTALGHICGDNRHIERFSELNAFFLCTGKDYAAAHK